MQAMQVEVRYFASLREALGRERETVALAAVEPRVADLLAELGAERGDAWTGPLRAPGVRPAVNAELADLDTRIHDGDEVAFLPPVTGG